jgi:hypothetical protein
LKTSLLRTSTGLFPDCSCPIVGFRSAQRISPLSIPARIPAHYPYLPQL